ncbi:molybdenum cofactor synthesis 2 [Auriscalpium vulgare]|uniref:Molybdenum cofactor synthesis 2 n=1 Tax=Auriscalpium vulgare TaxID=40419 RepID=A0ACB8RVT7_9AGAM|nr:molybdenum cofactor synthesis 2 [Auriscalpium vulgare]
MSVDLPSSASVEGRLETSDGLCVLTYKPLDASLITTSVQDDAAGAVAVFIGTTRNSFKGKVVTKLEYQAYTKLALKTMADVLRSARESVHRSAHHPAPASVPSLLHCTVHHRLGSVPVGQPSIVIAVSSPHRREAFAACEMILEEVKERVQIWKREYYEGDVDSEAQWKSNAGH